MSGLMDLISQHVGSAEIKQIAARLGVSEDQAESAVGMALPTLLGAAARKADDDAGVQELQQHLQQHDESVFSQLSGFLNGNSGASSGGMGGLGGAADLLGSLLGGRQGKVEQGIGKASGMSGTQVASLLAMLAPLVLGAISKKSKGSGTSTEDLSGMLKSEKKSMENQASGGLLAGLLDQDGDGDFDFRDIMAIGMKQFFGRKG